MKKSQKIKAFTLPELLLVIFIGTIIILAAYSLYQMSYLSFKKHTASSELTQNARIALERMTRELRQSPEIITNLPIDSSGVTPSEIKFQEGHNLYSVPPPACQYQYVTYQKSGTNLLRITSHYYYATEPDVCVKYDPDQPTLLQTQDSLVVKAENIAELKFWGTDKLITTRLKVSDGTIEYQFETKTMARNV